MRSDRRETKREATSAGGREVTWRRATLTARAGISLIDDMPEVLKNDRTLSAPGFHVGVPRQAARILLTLLGFYVLTISEIASGWAYRLKTVGISDGLTVFSNYGVMLSAL